MPDYSRTQIYMILCKDERNTEFYIGATTDFQNRMTKHKYDCNNENSKEYNYKVYTFIRPNGGWDNYKMMKIEDYPCEDKLQSDLREGYWIATLGAKLNSNLPRRSNKQYYIDNANIIKEQNKQYRIDNKDKINERDRLRYHNKKNQT